MKFSLCVSRFSFLLASSALLLSACATQRYGRLTPLSDTERREMTCHDIKIETAKAQEFLNNLGAERSNVSGAHVLGAMGDFGIGNMMEGDSAQASGEARLRDLQSLAAAKRC